MARNDGFERFGATQAHFAETGEAYIAAYTRLNTAYLVNLRFDNYRSTRAYANTYPLAFFTAYPFLRHRWVYADLDESLCLAPDKHSAIYGGFCLTHAGALLSCARKLSRSSFSVRFRFQASWSEPRPGRHPQKKELLTRQRTARRPRLNLKESCEFLLRPDSILHFPRAIVRSSGAVLHVGHFVQKMDGWPFVF